MKNFLQSTTFKKILCGIGVLIIALLIFQAGEFIGYKKASFSYRFGERYYQETFGRHRSQNFSETHGTVGKIVKISLPTIVIESTDNIENNVTISGYTMIRRQRENLQPADLKLNDSVTIIGSPNDKAEIEARLIRLMPTTTPDVQL